MSRSSAPYRPTEAAFVLPIGFLGMLILGVVVVATNGRLGQVPLVAATGLLVAGTAAVAEPLAAVPLAAIGWLTIAGFSHPPYAELHLSGTGPPAILLSLAAMTAAAAGTLVRSALGAKLRYATMTADEDVTMDDVTVRRTHSGDERGAAPPAVTYRPPGLSRGRLVLGLAMAAVTLPGLTAIMSVLRDDLAFVDELLVYLLTVIVITLVGGFWPAVLAAVAAGLLLNWYFTPPLHTWTIDAPTNLFALMLFVTCAVTVSSVVHLAARRDAIAVVRAAEATTLLDLARTVLGGDDSPQAILDHLARTVGVPAELQERSGGRWIRVAGARGGRDGYAVPAGAQLRLIVYGDLSGASIRLLDGFAAQAAAACERQRLRIQAGQAEALAEGNRMRTALLTAVSHDLRTPLASIKVAVGTLRQTDVELTESDRASLLATIEQGADRLDSLIGNLLDMSRIHTNALQPFVRPVVLDEVAPLLVSGLDGGERVRFAIPDTLPLIATDPGLLERALANLLANALRYSPSDRPPTLAALSADADTLTVLVIDHGPGIAPSQRERVFQPFQQLGDRHTGGGVGLGLAVAEGFIEAVGGRIRALSTPGGGLTMRVDLPTAEAAHEHSPNQS